MFPKLTKSILIKVTLMSSIMAAGYLTGVKTDTNNGIAYARSVYMTTQSISLRTGMAASTSKVATIPSVQAVDVISVYGNGAWAKVKWNGKTGYIHTMYLKLTKVSDSNNPTFASGSSTAASKSSGLVSGQSLQSDGYHMYATEELTLRKTASSSAAKLGTVSSRADLLIIDQSGAFYKVLYNGRYGWVAANYVKDYAPGGTANSTTSSGGTSSSPSSQTSTKASGAGDSLQSDGYHMVTSAQVNLRASASSSSNILGSLSKGTDVLIIDRSGQYYKIYYKGRYSYVHSAYLADYSNTSNSPSNSSGSSSVSSPTSGTAGSGSTTQGQSVRSDGYHMFAKKQTALRKSPSASSSVKTTIPANTDLLIIDQEGSFFKVYLNKTYSWVKKTDLADYSKGSTGSFGQSNSGNSGSGVSAENPKISGIRSNFVKINGMNTFSNTSIKVSGTVTTTRASKISVFLNGTFLSNASTDGTNFNYTIPSNVPLPGSNKVRIQATTPLGTLYQEETFTVNKVPTIVIDPGHGGADPGAVAIHNSIQYLEKNYDIKFATNLKNELVALGFKVVMTRTSDKFVENSDRVAITGANKADLLFSLHHNSAVASASGGLTIYPSVKNNPSTQASFSESKVLAEMLAGAYESAGMSYRGSYQDIHISGHTLYIMRNAQTRTILTEIGFLSNAKDVKKISNPAFQADLPRRIAKQIYNFFYGR